MRNVITDTHYDNPDRRGRHVAFMARFKILTAIYGIACNEYTAVCIGSDGIAHVYGDYPNYPEYAYFIQPSCNWWTSAPYCEAGQPLGWSGLMTYKVPGTMNGTNYFDVNNWENWNETHLGGSWESWSVNNGILTSVPGSGPDISCTLSLNENELNKMNVYPNPFNNFIRLENAENATVEIFNSLGQRIFVAKNFTSENITTSDYSNGLYFVKIQKDGKIEKIKIIKN